MKYIFLLFLALLSPQRVGDISLFISAAVRGAETKPPNLTRTGAELGRKVRAECIETVCPVCNADQKTPF